MMFEPTKNIDLAFRSMRALMLCIVAACLLICIYALNQNFQLSARMQDRVYILSGGKAMEALAGSRRENLAVEARDHVAMFHSYFFSMDPDEKAIAASMRKALYLADATAKRQYDDLVETGYIAGIISGNVSQRISIDSVQVSTVNEPYPFTCYANLRIIRATSIVTRSLISRGVLRSVARSDHNPHGFLIEHLEILENRDLKTELR